MPTASFSRSKYSTNVRVGPLQRRLVSVGLNVLDTVSPVFAEAVVKTLFFRPRTAPVPSQWKPILDAGQRFEVFLHGKRVVSWQWGQGPTVLLVHGWGSRGIHMGGFIQPLLDRGYSVVAFDGPGHGESDGATSSFFEMIDAVKWFTGAQSPFEVVGIIGHSFGAGAVVRALSDRADRFIATVLMAPAIRLRQLLLDTIDQHGIPHAIFHRLIRQLEDRFGYRLDEADPWRHLGCLAGPVMIVHDLQDSVVAFADSQELVSAHPAIDLHATSDLGHRRILTDPSVVDRVVGYISLKIATTSGAYRRKGDDMNTVYEEPLSRYRAASESDRIYMFLQYPDLREAFLRLDLVSPCQKAATVSSWRQRLGSRISRFRGQKEHCRI